MNREKHFPIAQYENDNCVLTNADGTILQNSTLCVSFSLLGWTLVAQTNWSGFDSVAGANSRWQRVPDKRSQRKEV